MGEDASAHLIPNTVTSALIGVFLVAGLIGSTAALLFRASGESSLKDASTPAGGCLGWRLVR